MGRRAEPTLLQQFLSAISRWRPRRHSTCSLASRSWRFLRSLIERGRPSAHWRERYKIAYCIKIHHTSIYIAFGFKLKMSFELPLLILVYIHAFGDSIKWSTVTATVLFVNQYLVWSRSYFPLVFAILFMVYTDKGCHIS